MKFIKHRIFSKSSFSATILKEWKKKKCACQNYSISCFHWQLLQQICNVFVYTKRDNMTTWIEPTCIYFRIDKQFITPCCISPCLNVLTKMFTFITIAMTPKAFFQGALYQHFAYFMPTSVCVLSKLFWFTVCCRILLFSHVKSAANLARTKSSLQAPAAAHQLLSWVLCVSNQIWLYTCILAFMSPGQLSLGSWSHHFFFFY